MATPECLTPPEAIPPAAELRGIEVATTDLLKPLRVSGGVYHSPDFEELAAYLDDLRLDDPVGLAQVRVRSTLYALQRTGRIVSIQEYEAALNAASDEAYSDETMERADRFLELTQEVDTAYAQVVAANNLMASFGATEMTNFGKNMAKQGFGKNKIPALSVLGAIEKNPHTPLGLVGLRSCEDILRVLYALELELDISELLKSQSTPYEQA